MLCIVLSFFLKQAHTEVYILFCHSQGQGVEVISYTMYNLFSFTWWNVSLSAFNSNNLSICVESVKAALELDFIFPQFSLLAQKAQTNTLWHSSVDSDAVDCGWRVAIATLAKYHCCCMALKVSCNICVIFLITLFLLETPSCQIGDWTKQSQNKLCNAFLWKPSNSSAAPYLRHESIWVLLSGVNTEETSISLSDRQIFFISKTPAALWVCN